MSNRDVIAQPIADLLGEHELDATPNTATRPACLPIFSQYQFAPEESLPPQVLHQLPPEATAEVHNSVPHQQGEERKAGSDGSEVITDQCQDIARRCDDRTSGMAAQYSPSRCDATATAHVSRDPSTDFRDRQRCRFTQVHSSSRKRNHAAFNPCPVLYAAPSRIPHGSHLRERQVPPLSRYRRRTRRG